MTCAIGVVVSGQWPQASNKFLPFTLYLTGSSKHYIINMEICVTFFDRKKFFFKEEEYFIIVKGS